MPEPLLTVRGLHMHFVLRRSLTSLVRRSTPDVLRAVDGVDLDLERGEALGLVGESGCGKSTLARCIVGLYSPTAGEITFDGKQLSAKRGRSERRRMQIVFQDPYSSLNPRMSVRQMLGELLRAHYALSKPTIDGRCRELMDMVGLSMRALDAYPHQFSGGQRQRVSIARALALEPEVLVADEPVSALDTSVQATILNLLASLRDQLGLSMLFIAHNMAVVRHVCDRVAVMYLGRIVESCPTGELFANARHPYTQGLLKAVPKLVPGRESEAPAVIGDPPSPIRLPSGCRFHPRCPKATDICRSREPPLVSGTHDTSHTAACFYAWDSPGDPHTSRKAITPPP